MEARVVAGIKGWQWIIDGFVLFRKSPSMWIALTFLLALLWVVSFVIPVLGPLLFNLLSPMLFAGLMVGCRALDRGEPLEFPHLFAGFRQQSASLVTVGGVYLVGTVVVVGIMLIAAKGNLSPAVLSKSGADIESMRAALRSLTFAFAVGLAVYVPVLMLVWFAPLLVVFDGLPAVAAMKLSFVACLVNTVPFLVYGLAVMTLWIALSLPAVLGPVGILLAVGLLVASVPVLICSIYASYKDVFTATAGTQGGSNSVLRQ